jgi:hypothetical protein
VLGHLREPVAQAVVLLVQMADLPAQLRNAPIALAAPTSAEAVEVERLKALLVEVLQRLARHEPDAMTLLDRITAPPGSDVRRAA